MAGSPLGRDPSPVLTLSTHEVEARRTGSSWSRTALGMPLSARLCGAVALAGIVPVDIIE